MERNHMLYVLEAARCQSISKAAEKLNIAQPSISAQIINIENELGVKLFERSRQRISLTEAGKVFVHSAEHILNDIDELSQTMRDFADKKRGRLKVGMLPIMTHLGFDEMIAGFLKRYPLFNVSITETGSAELIEQIMVNSLDTAIVIIPNEFRHENLNMFQLMEAPISAVMPHSHRLACLESISLNDCCGERLIIPYETFKMSRMIVDELCRRNICFEIFAECTQIETCFSLTAKGFGITFCSEQTAEHYADYKLKCVPVIDIQPRRIYLAYTKSPEYHPALDVFIKFVKNYFKHAKI